MSIDYDYRENIRSDQGPQRAIAHLFSAKPPTRLMDVGWSAGFCLEAGKDYAIWEGRAVDGADRTRARAIDAAPTLRCKASPNPQASLLNAELPERLPGNR